MKRYKNKVRYGLSLPDCVYIRCVCVFAYFLVNTCTFLLTYGKLYDLYLNDTFIYIKEPPRLHI